MSELTKRQEALIRSLYTRHGRRKTGLCLCEGVRCCGDLFESRPDLVDLVVCADDLEMALPPAETIRIARAHFNKFSATETAPGIMAVVRRPEPPSGAPEDPFIFVLDRVSDPGNFGTMIRTARAVGLQEVWYTTGSADPFSDKVIRSAMASQFVIGLREFADLNEVISALHGAGYFRIYRTDVDAGVNCFSERELFDRSAIVMGSEAHGAGEIVGSVPIHIPMPGNAESLNVAQAATVILFEHVRRTTPA